MQMHEYMQACMDSWESRKASLDEQEGFGNLFSHGWMDGWMDEWMDGWIFINTSCLLFFTFDSPDSPGQTKTFQCLQLTLNATPLHQKFADGGG